MTGSNEFPMAVDPDAVRTATNLRAMPALIAHKGNTTNLRYVASFNGGGDYRPSPQQARRDATARVNDGASGSSSGLFT